jgi:processive 1,2-diacylglycerol beta-glucosyltransferase
MTERTRILVLTLSFGSGHVRAAETVARELCVLAPGANVRVTDALRESRLPFRLAYVAPYWLMIRHAPALWRWFFARRTERRTGATAPEWAFRRGCPQVFEEIARWRPRVIVACEVAACEMASAARRRGLTGAKIVCVITDHEAEPVWVKPEVDAYAVADERVRASLIAWGAMPERVVVCGIPVEREFQRQRTQGEIAATRLRFGLERDAPVVLLMGGGMGPTRMDEVAAELCRADVPLQLVAVAGHDHRASRRLERVRDEHAVARPASRVTLQVLGWEDEIAQLMRAASVLVTKPGGLSTSEAAACALPCVLFDAIPGPEQRNARRLVEAGAGLETRGARATADAVLALVSDEHLRSRMSARAAQLAQPDATTQIARLALDAAQGSAIGDAMSKGVRAGAERDTTKRDTTTKREAATKRDTAMQHGVATECGAVRADAPGDVSDVKAKGLRRRTA